MELLTGLVILGYHTIVGVGLSDRRKLQDEIRQQSIVSVSSQVVAQPSFAVDAESSGSLRLEDDGLFEDGIEIPDTRHVVLHFKHKPEVVLNQNGYLLPKWDISWQPPPGSSYNDIGTPILRQFSRLYHRVTRGRLDKADAKTWSNVLYDVDYADYCEQIRPPLVAVGVLVRRDISGVVVRMAGGEDEQLGGEIARSLDIIDEGERFSVIFKRTKGKIVVFEDVCPLYDNDSAIRKDLRGMLA